MDMKLGYPSLDDLQWDALKRLSVKTCHINKQTTTLFRDSPLTRLTWLNIHGSTTPPIRNDHIRVLKTNHWNWMEADANGWTTSPLERLTLVLSPADTFIYTIPHPFTVPAVPPLTAALKIVTWKFTTPMVWRSYTEAAFVDFLKRYVPTYVFGAGSTLVFRGQVMKLLTNKADYFYLDQISVQFDRPRDLPMLVRWDYSLNGGDGRRYFVSDEFGQPPMGEGPGLSWMSRHKNGD
jgi:hypothetical protein